MRLLARVRLRAALVFVFVLAAALLAAGPAPPRADGAVAFVRARVVTMVPGAAVLEDQTVLVRGGRIAAIGPAERVEVPAGARRIDARGKFLAPGLADMHVHLEYVDDPRILTRFLAHGVTTVRSMDGRPSILQWRGQTADGALPGPAIVTAGPILDGDPPLRDDNTRVAGAEAGRAAVRAQKAAGYDFIKVYVNLGADAYRAILDEAGTAGLSVSGHVPRAVGLRGALDAGQRRLEHLSDLGAAMEADDSPVRGRWHWSRLYLAMPLDSPRVDSLARELGRLGMWIAPTLLERDRSLAPADTVARWLAAPELAALPAFWRQAWSERVLASAARMDADDWALAARGAQNRALVLRALHRAGVGLILGTDTPNPFVLPGLSVHEEMAAWVRAGIPARDVLAAATREAARSAGQRGEWGTVEVGTRADLLLLSANPLDDLAALRVPEGVMARGIWHPAARLHAWRR